MSPALRKLSIYTAIIFISALAYFVYVRFFVSVNTPQETLLTEIGEWFGELAMWAFIAIYFRTILKLCLGKGPISRRLLPNYKAPDTAADSLSKFIVYLDRSHIYIGIIAIALALIHIAFTGLHAEIVLFPIVLALVIWQGLFGYFLTWKGSPRNLKKWSYSVHAQLITGVAIGILAYFGHLIIDD